MKRKKIYIKPFKDSNVRQVGSLEYRLGELRFSCLFLRTCNLFLEDTGPILTLTFDVQYLLLTSKVKANLEPDCVIFQERIGSALICVDDIDILPRYTT